MRRKTFINILIVICLIIVAIFVIWKLDIFEKKDKPSIVNTEKIQSSYTAEEKNEAIEISLYFGGPKSNEKSEVVKETRVTNSDQLIGEFIMQELLKGPALVSESKPLFPKDIRLLSFSIKDGIAHINLNQVAEVPMTPSQEETVLKAIASSLDQLSTVNKVMITVENKNIETLGGNYSIIKPFGKEEINNLKIQK